MTLHVFPFQPARLRLVVKPHPTLAGRVAGVHAAEALAADPIVAFVCNGPMFDDNSGQANEGILARHLDLAAGIDYPTHRAGQGITFSVVGGAGIVQAHEAVAAGASVAVQCWPTLIWAGKASPVMPGDHVYRAALCAMKNGEWAVAVGKNTLDGFARELLAMNVVSAADLDGGKSTQLAHRDGTVFGYPQPVAVASLLAIHAA